MPLCIPGAGLCSYIPAPDSTVPGRVLSKQGGGFCPGLAELRESPVLDQGHPESGPNPSSNKGIGWGQEAEEGDSEGGGLGAASAAWRTSCSWGKQGHGRQNHFSALKGTSHPNLPTPPISLKAELRPQRKGPRPGRPRSCSRCGRSSAADVRCAPAGLR